MGSSSVEEPRQQENKNGKNCFPRRRTCMRCVRTNAVNASQPTHSIATPVLLQATASWGQIRPLSLVWSISEPLLLPLVELTNRYRDRITLHSGWHVFASQTTYISYIFNAERIHPRIQAGTDSSAYPSVGTSKAPPALLGRG